jgi:outer membrane protein TolC
MPAAPSDSAVWWRTAVPKAVYSVLEQVLANSPELRVARSEIDAARARLEQAEANTGPSLDLDVSAQAQRISADSSNSRAAVLDAYVPLDINGALGLRVDAARYALQSSIDEADRLQSDLANEFLSALLDSAEAAQRVDLLERQVEVAETLLRLIELRFAQGLASSVDVLQQRDEVAALRQEFPFARLARITAQNELRRISAVTPERPVPLATETLPEVSGRFPRIEPIELLDRRSSLRASRARIEAADARFAAALADRWPTASLSGGTLTRAMSGDVTTLVSAAIGAALTLFDSGSKVAIAAERRAWLAAAGEQYLADWVTAVVEVDNLIHLEASLRERITLSEQRLETAKALLVAAQQRYARGVSDYLPALAALRGQQQQQRDHLALQAELARSRIRLHRALGYPAGA